MSWLPNGFTETFGCAMHALLDSRCDMARKKPLQVHFLNFCELAVTLLSGSFWGFILCNYGLHWANGFCDVSGGFNSCISALSRLLSASQEDAAMHESYSHTYVSAAIRYMMQNSTQVRVCVCVCVCVCVPSICMCGVRANNSLSVSGVSSVS